MAILRLNVNADVVNALVPNFPFAARREFAEVNGFEFSIADGDDSDIPAPNLASLSAVVLQADQEVTVTLGTITLAPGGLIVIFDGVPASTPNVDNASGSAAVVRGLAFGE